jgi:hypothetical protein
MHEQIIANKIRRVRAATPAEKLLILEAYQI